MKPATFWFVAMMAMPAAAGAQAPLAAHVTFNTYAAGLRVAEVDAGIALSPSSYQIELAYHTTGMTSVFVHGYQYDAVAGAWSGLVPRPSRFLAQGHWRGQERVARIEYDRGVPVVKELRPTADEEREPVPSSLRQNTIDAVSALAQLVRTVEQTGRCDGALRTYDGRRAVEIQSTTAGEEMLRSTDRSIFAGKALRCDFIGRMVAGFKLDEDREKATRPLRGSAWLAPLRNGEPPLPVRIAFQTRWLGDMTMYLTSVGQGTTVDVARHQR